MWEYHTNWIDRYDIDRKLNEYGVRGWELCGIWLQDNDTTYRVFFKKPLLKEEYELRSPQ